MELVDISNNNAGLTIADIKAAGKAGVIAKASEGITFIDALYAGFRADAYAQGLIFGSYHYARPDLDTSVSDARKVVDDAQAEAAFFLAAATPQNGDMVALDYEKGSLLSPALQELWIATWLNEVEDATSQKPLLYTSAGFWASAATPTVPGGPGGTKDFGAYYLWLAAWGVNDGVRHPATPITGWSEIAIHQYTSQGSIAGKAVDLDYIAPTFEVATLQIGLQPTTIGDPYGPPFSAISKDGTVLGTSPTRTTAFTDLLYDAMAKDGEAKLTGTRKMA